MGPSSCHHAHSALPGLRSEQMALLAAAQSVGGSLLRVRSAPAASWRLRWPADRPRRGHRQQVANQHRGAGPRAMASTPAAASAATAASGGAALWQSISERYDTAQHNAAATMTDTRTEVVEDGGVSFVLRVAAKLRDKPKPPADADGKKAAKEFRNPFLPYEQALWVADLGASHVLLLNKFNIVPWHCLVVTAGFRSQLDDMDAGDWAATWAVLQCMLHGGLAFYNCGPVSGASQPHKHMQIVPLPLDGSAAEAGSSSSSNSEAQASSGTARPPIWPAVAAATAGKPAGEPVELRNLPFAAFAAALAPPQQAAAGAAQAAAAAAAGADAAAGDAPAAVGRYLEGVYQDLLGRCRAFVEAKTGRQGASPQDGSLSYNIVCTRDFMMLVPRRQEADGPVSCNSVAFAGSVFVRSAEEVQYVAQRGPMRILATTGFEW